MNMLRAKEQFAENELLARFLMNVEPDNPLRRFQLGEALYEQQHYQAALEQFEQVLTVAPESPRTADRVEAIFEVLQQPEIRKTFWQRLQELHPASPTLKGRL